MVKLEKVAQFPQESGLTTQVIDSLGVQLMDGIGPVNIGKALVISLPENYPDLTISKALSFTNEHCPPNMFYLHRDKQERKRWEKVYGVEFDMDSQRNCFYIGQGEVKLELSFEFAPWGKTLENPLSEYGLMQVLGGIMMMPLAEVKDQGIVFGDLNNQADSAMALPGKVLEKVFNQSFISDRLYLLWPEDMWPKDKERLTKELTKIQPVGVILREQEGSILVGVKQVADSDGKACFMLTCESCNQVNNVTDTITRLNNHPTEKQIVCCASCGGSLSI